MEGDFFGNCAALGWFLLFQVGGVLLAASFFGRRERFGATLLLGSAAGSVLAMWLPALFALFLGFTVAAQLAAAGALVLLVGAAALVCRPKLKPNFGDLKPRLLLPLFFLLLFAFLVLHGLRFENDAVYSSQCTYGDMNMHLGFITSIAEQGVFPPMYSILPGTKLSYPFLSDSISSSLHVLGGSLRLSYVFPMLFAGAQVFFGAWLFFGRVLKDNVKRIAAFLLFFLCGGFGFAYFLNGSAENPENFTRIFTAFYETPTNLVDENIRWVNVIVDILVPQRASLFGWAILFPLLYVLYRAVEEGMRRYFPAAGIFAGSMVMIHTHSFLALGIICGVWLLFSLAEKLERPAKIAAAVLFTLTVLMQFTVNTLVDRESWVFLAVVLVAAALFVALLVVLLIGAVLRGEGKRLLSTWGVFLLITLALAAPQLLTWTFTQAQGQQFVRGWYNWGNLTDGYLWFYVKNLGIMAVLAPVGLALAKGRLFRTAAPAVVLWFICEFAVFQPNTYDNNKLLYVAYFLLCVPAASILIDALRAVRARPLRYVAGGAALVLSTLSAVLTIGRESIASYRLYSPEHMAAAEFVMENTEPTDTFLTDTRHNNEVAALTGRNIVCGSSTYVYFHGLNYTARELDVRRMYENPGENTALFEQYSVDYVMLSDYEYANYAVDEAAFDALFTRIYDEGNVRIYKTQ